MGKPDIIRQLKFFQGWLSLWMQTIKGAYHFCMNCLNGFCTVSAGDKHCEYWNSSDHVKVNLPSKQEKWLEFHNVHHQFKVFESILKLVNEHYREKINQMRTGRRDKTPYTEKINTHALSVLCRIKIGL